VNPLLRLTLTSALLPCAAAGCMIDEPYSPPIPVPASYTPTRYAPTTSQPAAPTVTPIASTQPAQPPVIDDAARDAILAAAQANLTRRFGVATDPQLQDYLILVGSLVTINTPKPDVEYTYLLLDTDQPVHASVWPRTVAISRGLIRQMEDESELAGVLAREISHLLAARPLKAAGLPVPTDPATRPATTNPSAPAPSLALVTRHATRLTDLITNAGLPYDLEHAADVEGAQFAAAARYAPDGYLRLLTRQKPAASPATTTAPTWQRIQSLDAALQIIAKAYPAADVRLPVRFDQYARPKAANATTTP
jgi:predicted Zn-dependent protease